MKRYFLLAILICGLGTLTSNQANAQELDFGVAVSPLVFELSGKPGEVIENQFKVTNRAETRSEIEIEIEDIGPSDEEGHVTVEENSSYSLAKWVTTEPKILSLGPGESAWVNFKVNIPANAEPGGHYGTILASAKMISGASQTGAMIVPKVGVLVLLTVPGQMKENLTVKEFIAPKYSEYGPINFEIKFENKGTVHVRPAGVIVITNWLGKKVAAIAFPEKNILPGAVRKIEASWDQKWLWAGKYTATITGSYGISDTQMAPTVITFWAFPWKFGLIILAALLLLILARKRLFTATRVIIKGR